MRIDPLTFNIYDIENNPPPKDDKALNSRLEIYKINIDL